MPDPDPLTPIFADIASQIGMSRPAGACLAMIWRTAHAPCADDLTRLLGMSRSNVSTALKELRDWGLISIARTPGDRKEYFTAPAEPMELARLVIAARERRAIAPLLDRLAAAQEGSGDARLGGVLAALHSVAAWMRDAASAQDLGEFLQPGNAKTGNGQKKKKKKKKA